MWKNKRLALFFHCQNPLLNRDNEHLTHSDGTNTKFATTFSWILVTSIVWLRSKRKELGLWAMSYLQQPPEVVSIHLQESSCRIWQDNKRCFSNNIQSINTLYLILCRSFEPSCSSLSYPQNSLRTRSCISSAKA